jgi:hypothetical protein
MMEDKKKKSKKKKPKKDKPVFHKKSDAGKGDVPRVGISQDEWEGRWEKIFKPKVFLNKGMKKLINKVKDQGEI